MLCSKRRKNLGRGYRKPSNRKSNYSKRSKSLGRGRVRGRRKCSTRKSKYSKHTSYALSRMKQIGGDKLLNSTDGMYTYEVNFNTLTSLGKFMDYLHKFDKEATVVGYKLEETLTFSNVDKSILEALKTAVAEAFKGFKYEEKQEEDDAARVPEKLKYTVTYTTTENDKLPLTKFDRSGYDSPPFGKDVNEAHGHWYTIHIQTTVEDALDKYKEHMKQRDR